MRKVRYLLGELTTVFCAGLLVVGSAQTESAGAEQSYMDGADVAEAMSNPQDAAMIDFVARRLPGNEDVWYVVVLRSKTSNSKRFEVGLAGGRTAAAVEIAKFLRRNPKITRNPLSYTRWLGLEMYPNEYLAGLRCQAISGYAWRSGYR